MLPTKPPGIILLRLRDPKVPKRLKAILRAPEFGEKLYGYMTIVTRDHNKEKTPVI